MLRCSTRVSHPPERYTPSLDYVMLIDCGEPSCYAHAMSRNDKHKWKKAMQPRMDSLMKNGTWDLVWLLKGKHALPCKWVYKLKMSLVDALPKYKARLVAKGFKQEKAPQEPTSLDKRKVLLLHATQCLQGLNDQGSHTRGELAFS